MVNAANGAAHDDAIAVTGIACRLPGSADPLAFWQLLRNGRSAITPVPPNRPPAPSAGSETRYEGGFLDEVDGFDAGFFRIPPREAAMMDPQQRLMLELGWEALEDGRIRPGDLDGTRTGIFLGAIWDDYTTLLNQGGRESFNQHSLTGTQRAILANRLSYTLGLRGPSLTVDTAQSSSLVAVHLACESLRTGESALALAGGVNLIIAAESTDRTAAFGGLSPDSRCFTFDHRANGYVRGEGGGLVLLKPLARAIEDGDAIYCVIPGSAVNNDGGTQGLTVPSATAQADVLRRAHERAGVAPAEVQYVELHGTGTRVGDPVEAAALGAALGSARSPGDRLIVGSAKTNVGHLEGGAGIVGLLKTILSIRHRELPPSLNFETPNPDIDLDRLNLKVQAELTPWPHPDRPLIAGVSSFGMGGTNCHVVLAEPPATKAPATSEPRAVVVPWVLSATTGQALRAQAANLARQSGSHPVDVAYSLATTRTRFPHRAAVIASTATEFTTALTELAAGRPHPAVVRNRLDGDARGLVFMFSGQGSQHPGMGSQLYQTHPVFAAALDEICAELDPHLDHPLREVMFDRQSTLLAQTRYTQTALFALELALFRLVTHYGLQPDYLIGHSIGELTAACAAGVLSLPDACSLVATRARLMNTLPPGAMLNIQATIELPDHIDIAAYNSPAHTVASGSIEDIDHLAELLRAKGIKTRRLHVAHAFHSAHTEPILSAFTEHAATLTYRAPTTPIISNLTGTLATEEQLTDPGYWAQLIRQPVHFGPGITTLENLGATTYLELGPDTTLATLAKHTLSTALATSVLRRDQPEPNTLTTALAQVHLHGHNLDWEALLGAHHPRPVSLPTYAFQRTRHWLNTTTQAEPTSLTALDSRTVEDLVQAGVRAVLGHAPTDPVDLHSTFKDLGFESFAALELRGHLNAATNLNLPTTLLYDHATPQALIRHLSEELAGHVSVTTTAPLAHHEPVAIIGMGCRYPGGVRSPAELWQLVLQETDAISGFPADRGWPEEVHFAADGESYARAGGFLPDAADFDADFFGISPHEALAMDPQQRILLEIAWEALEHAGIDPTALHESPTGVYVGAMAEEYGPRRYEHSAELTGHRLTGTSLSIISGRIAYSLGLHGPAITTDTACSSSLVALHQAVQALRAGECTMALAGGVTVMATPGILTEFSRQRGLAPDGRCKSFATAADGTSFAEGAGLVVLQPLSAALREGRRVFGVIRGSAINQDGASNGLTAPSGPAQQRVIHAALANAGLTADQIDAVEAHGTGTTLGDPIEAHALLATYGRHRNGNPLHLGSLKSNLGHTQAAAGIGSVIKMVQALNHATLPKTLHIDEPSPHIDWSSGTLQLLTKTTPWPETDHPRRAAVSSFGISGTNAHVILEQPPAAEIHTKSPITAVVPWILSAKTDKALRAQATNLARRTDLHPIDVAHALTTRTLFPHRAAVIASNTNDLTAALEALTAGRTHPELISQVNDGGQGKLVLMFSGQGSQHPGMGSQLYPTHPVFAAALDEICTEFNIHLDHPLREVMFDRQGTLLAQTRYTQTALFALELALFRLITHYGLQPDYLIGHSIGELTAACAAGVLTLPDACSLVATRARLMNTLPPGAMLNVHGTADLLDQSDIAAYNSPTHTVASGSPEHIDQLAELLQAQGIKTQKLHVAHAFHSAHTEQILPEFTKHAATLSYHPPTIPIISNLTGTLATQEQLTDPGYWAQLIRQPVHFGPGITTLETLGATTYLELGPDTTLATLANHNTTALITATLNRNHPEPNTLTTALAQAHLHGHPLNWQTLLGPHQPQQVELPTYPFQRTRYWLNPSTAADRNRWRYRITWKQLSIQSPYRLSGRWLVVAPDGDPTADTLTEHLAGQGLDILNLRLTQNELDHSTLTDLLKSALSSDDEVTGILSLLALDDRPHSPDLPVPTGFAGTLALLQAIQDSDTTTPLWTVTRGAVATDETETPTHPDQTLVWGMGRVAALELPQHWGGLIDLPESLDERTLTTLCSVLARPEGEDQIAIRPSGAYARRLVRATPRKAKREWRPRDTALITGGTGGLGAHLARWLARNGARHIVLTSRRGDQAPGATELIAELAGLGVTAQVLACDLADRDSVAALVHKIDLPDAPLRVVVHAAGVNREAPLTQTTLTEMRDVLSGKVFGAQHLADLLAPRSLDALILYSSISGIWGAGNHTAYAAGNAFLDAFAQHCRRHDLPAHAIAWGPWAGGGMATDDNSFRERLTAHGLSTMAPEAALATLQQILDQDEVSSVVTDVDWTRFAPAFTLTRPSPLLAELPEAQVQESTAPQDNSTLVAQLTGLSPRQRERALLKLVRAQVAEILGHADAEDVGSARSFKSLGFESLTAVRLRNQLAAATGLRLPSTMIFDHPTPATLSAFLSGRIPLPDGKTHQPVRTQPDSAAPEDLATATDEELFSILDNEFQAP
ncbi:type I polyketide synthase [Crossiella sp. CA198]|uniref:type I polyketide synthase n=1 Tax=Crossiella sp. CA198 TaxID=3455607 RepID=UPI003F8D86F1